MNMSFRLESSIVHFFRYKQNGEQLYIPPDQFIEPNPINTSYLLLLLLLLIWSVVDEDDNDDSGDSVGSTRISSFIPFHKENIP